MIVTEKVFIKMNGKHISKYRDKGYKCNVNEIIEVDIKDLSPNSRTLIEAKCDYCSTMNSIQYGSYNHTILGGKKYCCFKCKHHKLTNTINEKYGVDNVSQIKDISIKVANTKLEKYGTTSYNNRDKAKNTMMEKYGTTSYNNRDKAERTSLERYGVNHIMQDKDILYKTQKSVKSSVKCGVHKDIHYRGTYELNFINFCIENNIQLERGPVVKYFFDSKNRYYYSDFYLKEYNLIIEVKSTYYYNMDYNKNMAKQKASIEKGYNFLFIKDNIFSEIYEIIHNK